MCETLYTRSLCSLDGKCVESLSEAVPIFPSTTERIYSYPALFFFLFFFLWLVDDKIYIYAMKSSETFSLMNLVDFNCELSLTILVWPIRIGVRTAATPAADAFE